MNKLFFNLPNFIQNTIISIYNSILYRTRYGGEYKKAKHVIRLNDKLSFLELKSLQEKEFLKFIEHSKLNSKFYKNQELKNINSLENISQLPILTKESLRASIKDVYTINKSQGVISKTGGTTGKPLEVLYTKKDMQTRFAFLDNFREKHGYKLGVKTAWFSGKKLLNAKNVKKNIFWKSDYINKVRYYSTFHIKDNYLKYYLQNLMDYKPEYFVGFPSTILEIAKYGIRNEIIFPKNQIKAVFPTAETVTKDMRVIIEDYFHTIIADQYASSEGAPFIFECKNRNLHIEMQSGVFEVLDDDNQPAKEGRLVITSFSTHGTPLIRYDIGDRIKLSENKKCNCGNNNPLVDEIIGRVSDYIYSPEIGKINLGNISNTLKGVSGIKKFQVVQDNINEIIIKIVIVENEFSDKEKRKFLDNWIDRVGVNMSIKIKIAKSIPSEKSGKFRIAINNIKTSIEKQQ